MSSLTTWCIENPGAGWQLEDVDQTCNFAPVVLRAEERRVFVQVFLIEERFPPFGMYEMASQVKSDCPRSCVTSAVLAPPA